MNSNPKKPGKAQLVAVAAILTSSLILAGFLYMQLRVFGGTGWAPASYPYRGIAIVIVVAAILLCLVIFRGVFYSLASSIRLRFQAPMKQKIAKKENAMSTPRPSQSTEFGSVQDRIASAANQEDEVKWMGRFGWLTDVRFNNFVTPGIVSVFYLLSLVIIGLGAVVYWLNTIEDSLDYEGAGGAFITALWTAPIIVFVALLAALLVRLIFESIMVVFRIAEDLRRIRDK